MLSVRNIACRIILFSYKCDWFLSVSILIFLEDIMFAYYDKYRENLFTNKLKKWWSRPHSKRTHAQEKRWGIILTLLWPVCVTEDLSHVVPRKHFYEISHNSYRYKLLISRIKSSFFLAKFNEKPLKLSFIF